MLRAALHFILKIVPWLRCHQIILEGRLNYGTLAASCLGTASAWWFPFGERGQAAERREGPGAPGATPHPPSPRALALRRRRPAQSAELGALKPFDLVFFCFFSKFRKCIHNFIYQCSKNLLICHRKHNLFCYTFSHVCVFDVFSLNMLLA